MSCSFLLTLLLGKSQMETMASTNNAITTAKTDMRLLFREVKLILAAKYFHKA